jgi:hypothetical protein
MTCLYSGRFFLRAARLTSATRDGPRLKRKRPQRFFVMAVTAQGRREYMFRHARKVNASLRSRFQKQTNCLLAVPAFNISARHFAFQSKDPVWTTISAAAGISPVHTATCIAEQCQFNN